MASSKNTRRRRPKAASTQEDLMGRELGNAVVFFHEAVAAHLGMSAAEWRCLGLVAEHGPSTAGRLAQMSGFTTGAITGIADRLERAGYVRRERHPEDRRSVIIKPLLRAKEVEDQVAPILQSLMARMAVVTSHYSAGELAAIAAFLAETTKVLRSETARLKHSKERPKSENRS
jgi:DNA-binding MarR family transcriptional regulator